MLKANVTWTRTYQRPAHSARNLHRNMQITWCTYCTSIRAGARLVASYPRHKWRFALCSTSYICVCLTHKRDMPYNWRSILGAYEVFKRLHNKNGKLWAHSVCSRGLFASNIADAICVYVSSIVYVCVTCGELPHRAFNFTQQVRVVQDKA